MFDASTAELMSKAPALDGLDLTALPSELTLAYSTIVSLRMRLREITVPEERNEELQTILARLERIGFAQEAYAALTPDRENRAAAAYVAAAAHQMRFAAEKLQSPVRIKSQIDAGAIGPEIAATVMFLIADRVADAAQMSRSIGLESSSSVEDQLRRSIADLARGNLGAITSSAWTPSDSADVESDDEALSLLWWRLLQGIRVLAEDLLGNGEGQVLEGASAAIFAEVRDLSVDVLEFGGTSQVLSVFPGPHHLASLLLSADGMLRNAAVVGIKPPSAISLKEWSDFLATLANRRPYLWPNHQQAIEAGYLLTGTSSVLSFPTGAGKSTLTELKIAISQISGKKTIYLAPTLALVAQVTSDLRKTFPDARGASADEMSQEDLSPVSVMTPERCLTLSAALARRNAIIASPNDFGWEDELASTTGVLSSSCIRSIAKHMRETVVEPTGSPKSWIKWGLDWLLANPSTLTDIVRPLTITGVFGKAFEGFTRTKLRGSPSWQKSFRLFLFGLRAPHSTRSSFF